MNTATTDAPAITSGPEPERRELGEHSTAPWKIRVLGECPAKFYLSAVAKDERRKESGFEGRVGTLLHHGIEHVAWLRAWLTLGHEPLSVEELLRGIDQPSKSKSVEAARRDPAALAEARLLAKKIAKHVDLAGMVVEQVGTKARPLVEEPWTLDVGEVDGKRVVVGGIWDLVRRGRGGIVITDWKKGGDVRGSDELRLDPAATLYAAAARARWPKEHVRVEHFYLTRGFSVGIDWTPEIDEWARMAALEFARACSAFERAGSWPATPSLRACSYCNFRATCTAFRDRVSRGFTLGAFDPAKKGDLAAVAAARAKADEDRKLAEKWIEDLDAVLEPVLARAAEAGEDEIVVSGQRVRRAKRSTTAFPEWRSTVRRVWELTGIAPEDLEDGLLSLKVSALDELLASRGYGREDRERIRAAIEETGTERSSTWIEVKPVADPLPSIDVEQTLATGVRVALPPPATESTTGAKDAGPGPQAAPAQAASPETLIAPPAGAPPAAQATVGCEPVASPAGGVSLTETEKGTARATPPAEPTKSERDAPAPVAMESGRQNPEGACAAPSGGGAAPPAPVERAEPPKESVGFNEASLGLSCPCGRSFQNKRGLSAHRRGCAAGKA